MIFSSNSAWKPELNCQCVGGKCFTDKSDQKPLLHAHLLGYLITLFHKTVAPVQPHLPCHHPLIWGLHTCKYPPTFSCCFYNPYLPGRALLLLLQGVFLSHPRWTADSWLRHHWLFWITFPNLGSAVCHDRWHHLNHPCYHAWNYSSFFCDTIF